MKKDPQLKNIFFLFIFLGIVLIPKPAQSQSSYDYTFSASSGSYSALTGATAASLTNLDNGFQNNIPIGFNFSYLGITYWTLNISANGFLTFGSSGNLSLTYANNNISTAGKRPLVAPLWDDLVVPAMSGVSYKSYGTAPNRKMVIEWNDVRWDHSSTIPVISFQVILNETTNIIQFVYKYVGTYNSGSNGASIGLADAANNSYFSVNGLSPTATASFSIATDNIEGPITSSLTGLTYTFTPPIVGVQRNWIGSGAGGTGTDFNDPNNWSPTGTPTAADDLIMNINSFGAGANSPHADLSATASGKSLAITFTGTTAGTRKTFSLNTGTNNLNITNLLSLNNASTGNGSGSLTTPGHTLTLNVNGGVTTVGKLDIANTNPSTTNYAFTNIAIATAANLIDNGDFAATISSGLNSQISISNSGTVNIQGNTLSKGIVSSGRILFDLKNPNANYIFNGSATFDDGSPSSTSDINIGGNKVGFMTFSGDVTFGTKAKSTGSNMIGTITFDAPVSQTVTVNSSSLNVIKFIAGKSASNSPVITLGGSNNIDLFSSSSSALTINNSSVIDLTSRSLNISGTQAGSFSMSAGSTMKLGAISGGANQNNFPGNYLVYTLNPTSTVEYNSLGNQDITGLVNTSVVTYGNLLLTASGSNNVRTLKASVIVNGNLTGTGGAILDLNNYVLTVNKDIVGFSGAPDGRFKANNANDVNLNSGLILGGSGTINFDASYNYLKTLTINAPSAPGASITLGNLLNIAAGSIVNGVDNYGTVTVNGKLYSNGFLTLKSNESGTSRIAESSGHTYGDVTVERFIKAKRAWRFLAVPFASSSQTIRDAWQEGVNNTDLVYSNNQNPNPGFGTHITYDNTISPNHGFDVNTTANPSLKTYNQSANNWVAPAPTISTNLKAQDSYLLFIRGSRAVNLSQGTGATPDNTVLRTKGIINEGTITKSFTNYTTSDNIFVANPFASSIDLASTLTNSTGIKPDQFSIWDPFLSGNYGVGGYRQYAHSLMVPFDEYNEFTNSTIIESGQAFMLKANDLHSTVNFHESDKTSVENFVQSSYQSASASFPRLYVNLKVPSGDSLATIDGVGAVFDTSFSRYITDEDVRKLYNSGIGSQPESITMIRNDTNLAIEAYPYPKTVKDTMNIRLFNLNSYTYNLKFFPQYIPPLSSTVELLDLYLNTTTPLSLSSPTTYSFTAVQGDTSTFRNRFKIVLKLNGAALAKLAGKSENGINKKGETVVKIYPNPVVSDKVYVRLENNNEGKYLFELLDNTGRLLKTKEVIVNSSSYTDYLKVDKNWASGKYQLVIVDPESNVISSSAIMVNSGSN